MESSLSLGVVELAARPAISWPATIRCEEAEWFRYYFFQPNPGAAWKLEEFDFDRDYKRLGMSEVSDWGNNPDLRRFKAAGGKLVSYAGWNDAVEGVLSTVGYDENAERLMGSRPATQDFFRLFVIPGMNHCGGGEGASTVDWLTYLEAWVEKAQAPDKIIGAHLKAEWVSEPVKFPLATEVIEFSRPIYPYPITSRLGTW